MNEKLVGRIRHLQLIATVFVFILVGLLCWDITGFDITKIQLSEWGVDSDTWWMWNGTLVLTAITILFNVSYWIYKHKRLRYKPIFYGLFTFMSICLILVSIFPTGYKQHMHDIPAFTYFFAYPLTIFVMGAVNRDNIRYNEWLKHLFLSITMMTLPLIFIKTFDGMAISEILHTVVVMIWNLTLLKKHEVTKKDRIEA